MPKQKTHKGLKKRVKITARGKLKRKRAGAGHLMSGKSGKQRRRLRQRSLVDKTQVRLMLRKVAV